MRDKVTIAVVAILAVAAAAGAYWYREDQQCKQRQQAVDARRAQLDVAAKKVPVGASKQEIEEFFRQNGMKAYFEIIGDQKDARGRVEMKGCSQHFGCGDDVAVFVEFKLDNEWRVVSSDVGLGWLSCI
jgi:predicted negative regulator of RcsB-dependent stress response